MTDHAPTDLRELEKLLRAAIGLIEPAQRVQREIMDNRRAQGLSEDGADKLLYGWRKLFDATKATPYDPEETEQALERVSALLRVVEAVAAFPSGVWCNFCTPVVRMGVDSPHKPDCAWVLARKLTGGAT